MSGRKRTSDPADNTPVLTRRAVVGGAGALIVSFTFAAGWAQETGVERRRRNENTGPKLPGSLDNDPFLDAWIRVDSQGAVTAFTGKVEFGQGIKTALLQVVAEELEVALQQVQLITADTAATPNEGFTSGSHSVQDSGTALRNAAAQVRDLLIAEAGARFKVPADQLRAENGAVTDAGGRRLTYGEIVAPNLLHVRAQPTSALKSPNDFKVMRRAVPRTDIPGKVTGGVAFVQDLRLPGMLHARIVRPPGYGAKLKSIETGAIEKMPGVVKIVRDGSFLAVVAQREFQAIKGMRALAEAAQWEENAHLPKGTDVETLLSSLTPKDTTIFETKGGAEEGGAGASAHSAAATYTRPYLSHGSIGPSCAVGHFIDGTVTVWTHTQGVYPDRQAIAEMLGFAPEKVRCIHMEGSGCYGHNGADDAAGDAALIAVSMPGQPIRVQWMREQEQAWEPFGPAMMAKVNATLDAAGRIASWNYGVWSNTHSMRPGPAGALLAGQHMTREFPPPAPRPLPQPEGGGDRNAIPLYVLRNAKVVHHFLPDMPLRVSALRSLGAYLNIYSIESFMDELALTAGADPVEFRLKHLEDPRAADVVRKAAGEFGWSTRERGGRGRGCGFAFARYKNLAAYCAIAMQIRVDLKSGHIRVGRVTAAVDAGQIINPDGVCNQIEGAIVQSLSWTMFESVSFDEARITSLDWARYPIMRFDSVPESVSVHPIDRPGTPFLGCGEAGQGPAAAALANAVADATGKRLRDLPLSPKRVKGMLTATRAALTCALTLTFVLALRALGADAGQGPQFKIDPWWPKPLPEHWITGRLGAVCVDSHDHVIVTNRRDITDEEKETSQQAPSVLFFSSSGELVQSWSGDWDAIPGVIHGCFADRDNNIWLTGNGDGVIQKYSHDGKLLLQIGTRGVFDTEDGTAKGKRRSAGHEALFNPAAVAVDPSNGDVYVADGYGNRRVAVFDRDGKFLRQWGRQATDEETRRGEPAVFAGVVHCITMSNAGLLYVCDRQGDRLEVFDKLGQFQRNIWLRTGTPELPDARGTAWWVGFSPDRAQKYLYVMNGRNEQVHVLDHSTGAILGSFGRPGHQLGNFTHGHTLAVDSKGNIYVAETESGRRIQKFSLSR